MINVVHMEERNQCCSFQAECPFVTEAILRPSICHPHPVPVLFTILASCENEHMMCAYSPFTSIPQYQYEV